MKKNMLLLLLLALIVVPAWAAEAVPAPSSDASTQAVQPAPKHKAKKHKAKKTEKKAEATDAPAAACYKMTCGGVQGCFLKGCLGSCTPC